MREKLTADQIGASFGLDDDDDEVLTLPTHQTTCWMVLMTRQTVLVTRVSIWQEGERCVGGEPQPAMHQHQRMQQWDSGWGWRLHNQQEVDVQKTSPIRCIGGRMMMRHIRNRGQAQSKVWVG
jgi:hypothetical protein